VEGDYSPEGRAQLQNFLGVVDPATNMRLFVKLKRSNTNDTTDLSTHDFLQHLVQCGAWLYHEYPDRHKDRRFISYVTTHTDMNGKREVEPFTEKAGIKEMIRSVRASEAPAELALVSYHHQQAATVQNSAALRRVLNPLQSLPLSAAAQAAAAGYQGHVQMAHTMNSDNRAVSIHDNSDRRTTINDHRTYNENRTTGVSIEDFVRAMKAVREEGQQAGAAQVAAAQAAAAGPHSGPRSK